MGTEEFGHLPPPPATTRAGSRRKAVVIAASAAVVVLLILLALLIVARRSARTLRGVVIVKVPTPPGQAPACARLPDGYSDIHSGSTVYVTNNYGEGVGSSKLGPAAVIPGGCRFQFEVHHLVGYDAYNVFVGRHGHTYSTHELNAADWSVTMTFG